MLESVLSVIIITIIIMKQLITSSSSAFLLLAWKLLDTMLTVVQCLSCAALYGHLCRGIPLCAFTDLH